MRIEYPEELENFMKEHHLGVGSISEKQRKDIHAVPTRFPRLHASKIWPLLKPARTLYHRIRITGYNIREGIKGNKRKQREFNRAFVQGLMPDEETRKAQTGRTFANPVKFSILAPLFNTPEKYLRDMMDSCVNQTYGNWELCLVDGSDDAHAYVGEVVKSYMEKNDRIRYEKLEKNLGISENTNACIRMATGDYIALFDHDDVLIPTALYENMCRIEETGADFLYSDEVTFLDEDIYNIITYHFKPDFAIDNLRANNYICHLSVFSKKLQEKVGLFNHDYDGSQDHEMILRLTDAAERIEHIAKVLYLWRAHKNSVSQDINSKTYAIDAGKRAVTDSIARAGMKAVVESSPAFPTIYKIDYEITEKPLISIIIPNKDCLDMLANCIDSVLKLSTYENIEILVVENNSETEEIEAYYKLIEQLPQVRVLRYPDGFNYSKINNFAVKEAKGEYILFLNNDIEVITPEWIEEMLMYAQRSDVGAVGAKLYFGNNTIQHNGVIVGAGPDGIAIHSHAGITKGEVGYMGRLYYAQDVSAVTAACMLLSKSVFDEVGGFDEKLAVAYNDVDLCLKIRKLGYLNVINPFAECWHYESISRGYEEKRGNEERFRGEVAYMKEKWQEVLSKEDPFYNPNVSKMKPWGYGPNAD